MATDLCCYLIHAYEAQNSTTGISSPIQPLLTDEEPEVQREQACVATLWDPGIVDMVLFVCKGSLKIIPLLCILCEYKDKNVNVM